MPPAQSNSTRGKFSSNQQKFIDAFVRETKRLKPPGIDAPVVAGWLVNEEPIGADYPVGHKDQNWLNIGNTDTVWVGGGNNVWDNPTTAGTYSARWMMGTWSDPGFGHAAPGIKRISSSFGKGIDAEVAAINSSGWASGTEASLPSLAHQYAGYIVSGITGSGSGSAGTNPGLASDIVGAASDAASAVADPLGLLPGIPNPLKPLEQVAAAVGDVATAIKDVATFLFSPSTWARVGKFMGGGILVIIALFMLASRTRSGGNAISTGKKVAKDAAVAAATS